MSVICNIFFVGYIHLVFKEKRNCDFLKLFICIVFGNSFVIHQQLKVLIKKNIYSCRWHLIMLKEREKIVICKTICMCRVL